MKRIWIVVPLFLGVATLPSAGQDFHVVASRTAVVRTQPDIGADDIVRLARGDAAACFTDEVTKQPEQRNRFYHVRLADGRTGWVSRFTVRAHTGRIPQTVPTPAESPVEVASREFHLAIGKPAAFLEIVNEGYIVGYDQRLKIPAWVQYRLRQQHLAADRPRSNAFAIDDRIPEPGRATLIDYEAAASRELWDERGLQPPATPNIPIYARGHLAPARDLARSDAIERSSYLLSNMAPQVHSGFNSGTWSALELRVRRWVEARGDLTIIVGPVFLSSEQQLKPLKKEGDRLDRARKDKVNVFAQPPTERQIIYNVVGANQVAVPTAFFKVVVDNSDAENPEIPHYRELDRDLKKLLVSVDEIERLTGLDLLTALPNEVENRIEAIVADELW
ncbi:MAG: DNA/RNA non-specific endonuclease [Planctomycetes bacterium]|nr:DNA/RNA non-specific endonuclease [Planctomycetota bacterium]